MREVGNEQAARFLGLDLAWSTKHPSGLAALDRAGRLLDLRGDVHDDDAILAWIDAWRGERGAIAIDMPTIVTNAKGRRPCEAELQSVYHRQHAGPYPANLGLASFHDGGRAVRLLTALAARGVVHDCTVVRHDPRTVAFEVFPHPAAVTLFALPRVLAYKKKRRAWPAVLDAWARYRELLAGLERADPPLLLDDAVVPPRVDQRGYKRWDDALDAILCAYVASWVWHHGTADATKVCVFGNMETGHIVVPVGPALPA
jgi:predicted RNase H-like nuclease